MPSISSISIEIRAQTRQFVRGIKRATRSIKRFTSAILGGMIRGLLKFGAILVALATGALVIFLKKQAEMLDLLAKTARSMKIQTKFLQGVQFAASQTGVSLEQMNKAMMRFTRGIGEAKVGVGSGVTAFKALGANIKDFANIGVEEAFFKIADMVDKIQDPMKQGAIAFQFFGRQGIQLLNLINKGTDEIKAFIRESERINGVFSKLELSRVERMNDALAKTKLAFDSIFSRIDTMIAPFVTFFADKVTKFFVTIRRDLEGMEGVIRSGIVVSLTRLAKVVIALAMLFKIVAKGIEKFFGLDAPGAVGKFEDSILKGIATIAFFVDKIGGTKGKITDDFKDIGNIIVISFKSAFETIGGNLTALFKSMITGFKFMGKVIARIFEESLNPLFSDKPIKDRFNDAFFDDIENIRKGLKPEQIKNEKAFKSFADTFEKNLNEFAEKTKGKKGGALAKTLEELLLGNKGDLNAFVEKFVKEVDREGAKFESALLNLFNDLKFEIGTDTDMIDELKKVQNIVPKLAIKGSQEAARAQAGTIGIEQAQLNTEKEQLKEEKKHTKLLEGLNQTMKNFGQIGAPIVDPFAPNNMIGNV